MRLPCSLDHPRHYRRTDRRSSMNSDAKYYITVAILAMLALAVILAVAAL